MSRSLNRVQIIGNLGADPDVRTTPGGARVATLSIATSRRWTDRQGQPQEKTEWHRVIFWEKLADLADQYLKKGDRVYVETRDSWYVYRLERDQIVLPQDVWVIDPVPGQPGATPTESLITLTTCNPRWASYERWIWWGQLEDTIDKSTGETPSAILEGS